MAGPPLVAKAERRNLFEDERQVVDLDVGAKPSLGLRPPDEPGVEVLGTNRIRHQVVRRDERPGYGFSGPTREPGWNIYRIAAAWVELMRRLGYERYGAVGNDAGSMISPEVGRLDPEHVVGVHVTQIFSFPSGDPSEFAGMTEEEQRELGTLQWFVENKMSFNTLMAQQPQTLGYAISDSPLGLLAWNGQLLGEDLDPDFAISNVMLYWLTGTGTSAARLYHENAHVTERPTGPTTLPLALAGFGGDFSGIRRFAERDHANIVRWTMFDRGGHFAAHKAPNELIGDIRAFFTELR